jgi:hypothetical protein
MMMSCQFDLLLKPNEQVKEIALRYQRRYPVTTIREWNDLLDRIASRHRWQTYLVTRSHKAEGWDESIAGFGIHCKRPFSEKDSSVFYPGYSSRADTRAKKLERVQEMISVSIDEALGRFYEEPRLLSKRIYSSGGWVKGKTVHPFTLLDDDKEIIFECICGQKIPKPYGWTPRDRKGRFSEGFGWSVDIRHDLCFRVSESPGRTIEKNLINILNEVTRNGRNRKKNHQNIGRTESNTIRDAR